MSLTAGLFEEIPAHDHRDITIVLWR